MNSTIISVFDLSPPEKLQLVEDLWDDLAITPEAASVGRNSVSVLHRMRARANSVEKY